MQNSRGSPGPKYFEQVAQCLGPRLVVENFLDFGLDLMNFVRFLPKGSKGKAKIDVLGISAKCLDFFMWPLPGKPSGKACRSVLVLWKQRFS